MPPGPSILAAVGRALGSRDVRTPAFLALVLLAVTLARRLTTDPALSLAAVVLLAAPLALGTILGSLAALGLCLVVGSGLLAVGGGARRAGLLAGLAVALDHHVALVAPFVLVPLARGGGGRRPIARALGFGVLGYVGLVLPVAALDPGSFLARLVAASPTGPGLGVFNLLAYLGVEGSGPARVLAGLAPLLAGLGALGLVRRDGPPLAFAALAALLWLAVAPAAPPDAVALPLVLLALGAVWPTPEAAASP